MRTGEGRPVSLPIMPAMARGVMRCPGQGMSLAVRIRVKDHIVPVVLLDDPAIVEISVEPVVVGLVYVVSVAIPPDMAVHVNWPAVITVRRRRAAAGQPGHGHRQSGHKSCHHKGLLVF